MAKREVIDCDRCGEGPLVSPVCLNVATHTTRCPASGRSEDWIEPVDLCPACAATLLYHLVDGMTYGQRTAWHKAIIEHPKRARK